MHTNLPNEKRPFRIVTRLVALTVALLCSGCARTVVPGWGAPLGAFGTGLLVEQFALDCSPPAGSDGLSFHARIRSTSSDAGQPLNILGGSILSPDGAIVGTFGIDQMTLPRGLEGESIQNRTGSFVQTGACVCQAADGGVAPRVEVRISLTDGLLTQYATSFLVMPICR